jgi:hypothetical protein
MAAPVPEMMYGSLYGELGKTRREVDVLIVVLWEVVT